ncbi:hypothetical protein HGM15179_005962 [Zosterops borbonicus]|uniref:Uncharacterized protein n=1 Tax=Zosterops borbonicus TaxID=364589 RepID=A0A8K1GLI0_9PASS|nr:hypothetical protein HGM15179_005962 [Zosterops borbonicus]
MGRSRIKKTMRRRLKKTMSDDEGFEQEEHSTDEEKGNDAEICCEAAESTKEHTTDFLDCSAVCVQGEGGGYLKVRDFFQASENF